MTQAALAQALAPNRTIAADLGLTKPAEAAWFTAAYSLTVGTLILPSGRLGDVYGHARVFTIGWLWFAVWSSYAAFAAYTRQPVFFDLCRAMQGVGPALLMPNGLALLGRFYPPGLRKNMVFSVFGASAPLGFVVGAVSASGLSQLLWWPWAFWTFALACLGLAVLSMLVVPAAISGVPRRDDEEHEHGGQFGE